MEDSSPSGPPTVFTDRWYEEKNEHWEGFPGLVYHSGRFQRGNVPPLMHHGPCGDPSWYTDGLSYADYTGGKYPDCDCPLAWQDLAGCACVGGTVAATIGYPATGCVCIDGRMSMYPGYLATGCICAAAWTGSLTGCTCVGGQLANLTGCACVSGQLANLAGCACISAWLPNLTGCACASGTITQGGGESLACSTTGQPTTLILEVTPTLPTAPGPFTLIGPGVWAYPFGPFGSGEAVIDLVCNGGGQPWDLNLEGTGGSFGGRLADSGVGTAPIDTSWHHIDLSGYGGSSDSTIRVHT